MNMKAQYCFDKGLLVPKEPLASMLFLEFIRDYNKDNKHRISFTIKDDEVSNDPFEEFFLIRVTKMRITGMCREFYIDAAEYINANS